MGREALPQRRKSENVEFTCRNIRYTATLGYYSDGRLGEVFLFAGKVGTDVDIATRDSAIALSLALQNGCPVEQLRSAFLRDAPGAAEGPLGKLLDLLSIANKVIPVTPPGRPTGPLRPDGTYDPRGS